MSPVFNWAVWLAFSVLAFALSTQPSDQLSSFSAFLDETDPAVVDIRITYIPNEGQMDDHTLFMTQVGGVTLYFHRDGVSRLFARDIGADEREYGFPHAEEIDLPDRNYQPHSAREITVTRTSFPGANMACEIVGLEPQPTVHNYILGRDPDKWYMSVPTYGAILYKDIYPDIDLKYYGLEGQIKYDYIVRPGGDLSRIAVRYDGMDELQVTPGGSLRLVTEAGFVEEGYPRIYQERDGRRVEIAGRYEIRGADGFGFVLEGSYDVTQPLIVDPILSHCNYYGGTLEDWGYDVTIDDSFLPCVYMVGHTWSYPFPTDGLYAARQDTIYGEFDAFVSKYDLGGKVPIFSTYFGGTGDEWGYGVAVDPNGSVYLCGTTSSSDFPDTMAYDSILGGAFDGFAVKLSSEGALVYATLLGGGDYDVCNDIAVDGSGRAYVTGMTYSSSFPTTAGAFQEKSDGYWDAFVTRFNTSGNGLEFSTLIGGSGIETSYGIALDESGNAFITGWTMSNDFDITPSAFQPDPAGEHDCFVTKLKATGDELLYSSFLGGDSSDYGKDIAVDPSGSAYVTGWSNSSEFPATNSYGGNTDAFAAKVSADGSSLDYFRFLGGSGRDCGYAITLDDSQRAYVTGRTDAASYPTAGSVTMSYNGGIDAFLSELKADGTGLLYSTFLGGASDDWGYGMALWDLPLPIGQIVYVNGKTGSDDLPRTDTINNPFAGTFDAFLAMFLVEDVELPIACLDSIKPNPADSNAQVRFYGSGLHETLEFDDNLPVGFVAYRWQSDLDGHLSDDSAFSSTELSVGKHQISFAVQDSLFVWSADSVIELDIVIQGNTQPIAFIDSIVPTSATLGDTIYFGGRGVDGDDDDITAWEWKSDRDGPLSSYSADSTASLSLGSHVISFRVMDGQHWSSWVTDNIHITEPSIERWELSWWYPDHAGAYDLLMHDRYSCSLFVTNISQHDQEFNFGVDMSFVLKNASDQEIDIPTDWSLSLDTACVMNDSLDYEWGLVLIDSFAANETKTYVFRTRNDWQWIPPWSLTRLIPIFLSFVLDGGPALAYEAIGYLNSTLAYFLSYPVETEMSYTFLGDAAQKEPGKDYSVWIRPAKGVYYWKTLVYGFIASRFTQLAGLIAPIPVYGQPISIVLYVAEAITFGIGELYYWMATDPDSDYTVRVDPQPLSSLPFYTAVDTLPEECWKHIANESMEMYALTDAAFRSYAKFAGAVQDGSTEWAAKQLAVSHTCFGKTNAVLNELNEYAYSFTSTVGVPDADDVARIRDDLSDNGLPQIEKDILTSLGMGPGLDSVADSFVAAYDAENGLDWAGSFSWMTDSVRVTTSTTKQLVSSLIGIGVPGALIGEVVKVDPEIVAVDTIPPPTVSVWVEFPGLIFPLLECDLVSTMVNDQITVADILTPVTMDHDSDLVPEIKITFSPALTQTGVLTQSIFGDLITPGDDILDIDTIPYSVAALVKFISSSVPTAVTGCVLKPGTFEPIENAIVSACIYPSCTPPCWSAMTDTSGNFTITGLPEGSYNLCYSHPIIGDSTIGPVQVSANDTTFTCMMLGDPGSTGCCIGLTGNIDGDEGDITDIGDLTALIGYLFIPPFTPPDCMEEGNVDGSVGGIVDIGDLTALIGYLFIPPFSPPAPCP